jgi:UTP--glucose-1-phosphate uridylyltransferase
MKVIIPCAGYGTRFLPATKTIAKEMLPILDKPLILYAIEEAVEAGIDNVIIISSHGKSSLENFFYSMPGLDAFLKEKDKTDLFEQIKEIENKAHVLIIRQEQALGLGHAILQAKEVCQDDFAVILPDELILKSKNQKLSTLKQLVDSFKEHNKSTVATMEVDRSEVSKYGIVEYSNEIQQDLFTVSRLLEKPNPEQTLSRLALPGRYVFTQSLFRYLEKTQPGKGGEIQLTDAMALLSEQEGMLAQKVNPIRFDAGDKLGFLMAQVYLGLNDSRFSQPFLSFIKDQIKEFNHS